MQNRATARVAPTDGQGIWNTGYGEYKIIQGFFEGGVSAV